MKHLSILVPKGENNLSSIVGAYKLFSRANAIFRHKGKQDVFQVELIGHNRSTRFYDGLFTVKPHRVLKEVSSTNLIIIPSLNHQYIHALKENTTMAAWIRSRYEEGAEVASICTGAFLLASTGLLNGKPCSTHWSAVHEFKRHFPEVHVLPDQLITDEAGLYTNGGAYSFLNLMLYLIEKFYDRETSVYCAKIFQIEVSRHAQSEFIIFSGQKNHDDKVVADSQVFIEKHYAGKISIQKLADDMHLSRRSFDRRFFKATGFTPLDYLQRVRIEVAKKQLENSTLSIGEVMYEVGYADAKAFREVFSRITGLSPLEYKAKYNKNRIFKNLT